MTGFLLDGTRLDRWAAGLAESYRGAEPFPHVVIDGLLDEALAARLVAEFPGPGDLDWKRHEHRHSRKLACGADERMGETTRALVWELNSARFLRFLEALTGIAGLIPDPLLHGGGLHQIERGGFLGVHADFNRHPEWRLDRRLNLLLYLNPGWREDYGGHLELWDRAAARCVRRILPIANRCVIFSTTDRSFHGHPEPLVCPVGETRKSIALYYYSNGRPADEVSEPHTTIYREGLAAPAGPAPGVVARLRRWLALRG